MNRSSFSALPPVDRRWILRTLALGGAGLAASVAGCAPAASDIAAEAIDPETTLFTGAGGNVVVTSTGEGLVVVDSGLAENAASLMKAISRRYRGEKPAVAFNTHWHYDHTGGNELLREAGARIYAHENTRLWLQGDFDVPWENRHYSPLPEPMWPTDTFYYGGGSLSVGGRAVDYLWLPRAHTDGDIYVHLKDADVLVVGDLVSVGSYPILDYATGGWIGELTKACEALLALAGPDTKIVPGSGPVVGRDHLQAQYDMLVAVRDRLYEHCRLGHSPQEMLEARATEGFDEAWGDPTLFVMNAYPGMWSHAGELGRVV
jgi:glyoxylase-like metal-dependent hydrolase (beta-lactamase superfamily II)